MEKKVREYIEKNNLISKEQLILLGLSGGADSVALLRILLAIGYRCVAVHCNFHLRAEESNRDQQFVEQLCSRLGVKLELCSYDTISYAAEKKISIEMAARELRYADFERLRQEYNANSIAVAHHRDDSVETLLMNLMRGTGIRGLTGIKPKNGYVIRPLLSVERVEIEEYLNSIGQDYVTDSTNLETDYTRNKIRLNLLPLMRVINPNADRAIENTALHLQQAYLIYNDAVQKAIADVVKREDEVLIIDTDALLATASPAAILYEILSGYGYNEQQVSDIMESLDAESGRRFTSAGYLLYKERNRLVLMKNDDVDFCVAVDLNTTDNIMLPDGRILRFEFRDGDAEIARDSTVATLDADKVGNSLTVRVWQQGDSFIPFGMKGRKLLSDYMTDRKFSITKKRNQCVVCNDCALVWVVGERSDNRYRITKDTVRQLVISVY